MLVQEAQGRHVGFFLCLPEGMLLRQRQGKKRLQPPVGRAGSVVAFGDAQIGIAVAHRQHAVPVKDGQTQPGAQVPQQQPLDLTPAKALRRDTGKGHGRPEGALGEAVGQAPAIGQGASFTVKPAGKAGRDEPGALHKPGAALRVLPAHDRRVNQAVKMEAPQGIIVPLGGLVEVPAVAHVMAFHQVQILPHTGLIHGLAGLAQPQVDQDAEKTPVVPGHIIGIDLSQPPAKALLLGSGKLSKKAFRYQAKPHAQHRHFHHALVKVPDVSPIFRVLGVRAVDQAFPP